MLGKHLRWLAPVALFTLSGCGSCGGASAAGASDAAPSASAEGPAGSASPVASASAPPAGSTGPFTPPLDVPQILDLGSGRATAALRAALQAYGLPFDPATLERDCKVDEEGASLDDLEGAAGKYGLEAGLIIVPAEHLLLPEANMLPAIVIVQAPGDEEELLLVWRLDGDRVQVMSPRVGRRWLSRAELQKSLYVHETELPASVYREVMGEPAFGLALRARMTARGVDGAAAQALVARAAADPGWHGFAALDAAVRKVESESVDGGVDAGAGARLSALLACAMEKKCVGVPPIPADLWSMQEGAKGPKGEAQIKVQGTVLLAIAGRAAPDAGAADGP